LPKGGNSGRRARDRKHGERMGFHRHLQVISTYSVTVEVPGRCRSVVPVVAALAKEIAGWHLGGGTATALALRQTASPTLFERRPPSWSTGKDDLDKHCGRGCDRHVGRNP
jgi:hypothetical protein